MQACLDVSRDARLVRPARVSLLLLLLAALPACDTHATPAAGAGAAPVAGARSTDVAAVHLADALASARIKAAPAASAERAPRVWTFDEPRPDWTVQDHAQTARLAAVTTAQQPDSLRLALHAADGVTGMLMGGLVGLVDGGPLSSWAGVRVRARTHERLSGVSVGYNLDEDGALPQRWAFMMAGEGTAPVFGDGSVQDYMLPLRPRETGAPATASATASGESGAVLRSLGIFIGAPGEGSLDILSITLVPRGAEFEHDTGTLAVARGGESRHSLYAHAPAELAFPLRVPVGGRLDVGLSGLAGESVTHVISVRADGVTSVLLDEPIDSSDAWAQRSLDLSPWAGRDIELLLQAHADEPDAVALWGAPIVGGTARDARPNVLFYVIDGGGADQMSVFGYDRPTTPFLSELAKQGIVFERAFSSATWTQPSTAAFMTGLHHSVLGGLRRGLHSTPVPDAATTMAEHFRRGGWFTTSLTTNPNCARVIGLQRGVDVMDDSVEETEELPSSLALQQRFLELRAQYPQSPWWAHIQTTDVHEPNHPTERFEGHFVPEADREELEQWDDALHEAGKGLFGATSMLHFYDEALSRAGLDRHAYYDRRRGLYDETMMQQDESLRLFVQQLKDAGEWENTILVIGADHGHPAGTFARWGRGLFEPKPPEWEGALFDSYSTRVPLIVVWPAQLKGGRRIAEAVSMIDVLPTVLDLAGLPQPEVCQGRSLAPALRGAALPAQPVLFDEVRVDEASGQFIGNIEAIDGRWGASLEVGPGAPGSDGVHGRYAVPSGGRWAAVHPWFADTPRLLLYDLQDDRFVRHAVNDEHPDLVAKYEKLLRERWQAHQLLGQRYGQAASAELSAEQLEQLKALGYVR